MSFDKKLLDFNKDKLERLTEINQPLRQDFNIYLFSYRKIYLEGHLFQLTADENWLKNGPNQGIYLSNEIKPKLIQTLEDKRKSFLWSGNQKDPLYEALLEFNIWNGITFYELKEDYIEIFAYASEKENTQAVNFYLNNMDLLNHFRMFFKEKLNALLSEEDTKTLAIKLNDEINLSKPDQEFVQKNLAFLEATQFSHHFVTCGSKNISLTTREAEVLFQLSQGNRVKEIAKSLTYLSPSNKTTTISPRTIETYWELIKNKFNHLPRAEIINAFIKSDVYNIMRYRNKVYSSSKH